MHSEGISGDYVLASSATKPRANGKDKYWCQFVPDPTAFRNLHNGIQQGLAWRKLLANIRAKPRGLPPLSNQDQDIFHDVIKHHCLNPSQALAVPQVLDESCITASTGGAGTGKSETLVACIKAVLWQQGYIVAQNPYPAHPGTISQGKRVRGPEGDNRPRLCVLLTTPTNAQVDNLLSRVHEKSYVDRVFRAHVIGDHPAPWLRLRAQRAAAPPGLRSYDQEKVQETLGDTLGCRPTLACALNSCRVVFATAGMVANRHRLLLGAAPPVVIHRPAILHGHLSRPSNTTMWICNLLALMCIGMTPTGSAPPAPCNSFCTAHGTMAISWHNSTA